MMAPNGMVTGIGSRHPVLGLSILASMDFVNDSLSGISISRAGIPDDTLFIYLASVTPFTRFIRQRSQLRLHRHAAARAS